MEPEALTGQFVELVGRKLTHSSENKPFWKIGCWRSHFSSPFTRDDKVKRSKEPEFHIHLTFFDNLL